MSRSLKKAFYETLLVMCLIAFPCTTSASQPDLSEQCAQALVGVVKNSAAAVASPGGLIRIGRREVRLAARIENDEHADTKYLIGLRVDVFVDGVLQPLTYGSVGVGSDREDAIGTAVSEWASAVGEALLGALGVKIGEEPQQVGPFLVYQGPAGIRGSDRVIWSSENDKRLLHHLTAIVQGLERSPGELHSISLMVFVGRDGMTKGECRIDGAISPAVLKAAQSFSWGQDGLEYLFKKFYVVRRR
jgi:hypothetical protein